MTALGKVAVVGGSGRLGRHVVQAIGDTADVTVVDIAPPADGAERFVHVDVLDLDAVVGALDGHDAVVLTAAIPNPRTAPPEVTFTTNVVGTWNVLQAASTLGIDKVAVTSSDAATGLHYNPPGWRPQYLPVDEEHPLRPSEVYSLSKEVTEAICRSFTAQSSMAVTVVRPTHIVFPPEHPELRERGSDVHNYHLWAYVEPADVAQVFRLALASDAEPGSCEAFFVSAADTLCERPTLEMAEERWGELPVIHRPEVFEANPYASILDISKATRVLGFDPKSDWRRLAA